VNSTYFKYWVNTGGGNGPSGYLNCDDGTVNVVVTNTYIEFIGGVGQYYYVYYSGSYSFNNVFETLEQMQTANFGTDVFTGGNLNIKILITST
jgi:hypothetical protein